MTGAGGSAAGSGVGRASRPGVLTFDDTPPWWEVMPAWQWAGLALGVALLISGLVLLAWSCGWFEWLKASLPGSDRGAAAYRALARRLGIRRRHRSLLARLSEAVGEPAVALLVCESAFERAAAAVESRRHAAGETLSVFERRRLLEARHALFGGE